MLSLSSASARIADAGWSVRTTTGHASADRMLANCRRTSCCSWWRIAAAMFAGGIASASAVATGRTNSAAVTTRTVPPKRRCRSAATARAPPDAGRPPVATSIRFVRERGETRVRIPSLLPRRVATSCPVRSVRQSWVRSSHGLSGNPPAESGNAPYRPNETRRTPLTRARPYTEQGTSAPFVDGARRSRI